MGDLLLAPEDRPSLDSWLTTSKPMDKKQLGLYFYHVHGYKIADHGVCPEHQSALDFLWALFSANPLDPDLFALAAKGTGKTFDLALAHVANSIFKEKCWTVHMGALQAQADRCYKYFSDELLKPSLSPFVLGTPIKSKTEFKNGARVEVVPGTVGAASGPHEHIGVIDEFDLLDYDVWMHFSKTPHESDGIPAQIVLASTRFKKAGPVMRVIDDLGKNLKTFSWCILDAMAPCVYDCDNVPGVGKCPLFERKVLRQGVEVNEIMCGGKAHNATGHLTYAQVLKEFLRSDQVSWGTLQLLEEPGSEGMFFPECDDVKHISADYTYREGRQVFLGVDWGFADGGAACLGAWQVREDGLVYQFYELYGPGMTAADMLVKIENKPWIKDIVGGWPDPSGKDQIETFRRWFVDKLHKPIMSFKTDNDRLSGWSALRRRLRGPRGEIKIGWHTSCKDTWADIKGLSRDENKPEDCEKRQDHGADESRYFVRNYDKYANLMRDIDEPEDDAVSEQEKIGESILEHDIKERINALKQSGISIRAILETEKQVGNDRKRFLNVLSEWYTERTLHGRMARAGMETYDDTPRD